MPYHRLILAVVLINLGVLCYHLDRGDWLIADGSALSALSALTLVNFTAAVVIRQQNILNILFGLAGRGSRSWPLWIRWSVSKVHHVGGIHVGAALAGTAWLSAFTCVAILARARHPASVSLTTLVLCYCLVTLAVLVVVCAAPPVRSRAHNVFELSHRFGGWTAIALFWADGAGTFTPPGHWNAIAFQLLRTHRLPLRREALLFATLNTAQADAFICAWLAKYTYWSLRPVTAIRLELDPTWTPLITTPPFPSYISGHSTTSAAAAAVLSRFFPREARQLRAWARQAVVSRLYGGIHFRSDNEAGLRVGAAAGRAAVAAWLGRSG